MRVPKLLGYIVNIQKSIAFMYSNTDQLDLHNIMGISFIIMKKTAPPK